MLDHTAEQDDTRASVHVIVGRGPETIGGVPYPGSGVLNSGVINASILNPVGVPLSIDRTNDAVSKAIEFTLHNLTVQGASETADKPLIQVKSAKRVVVSRVRGDVGNGGAAIEAALQAGESVDELVIDDLAVVEATNSRPLWSFAGVARADVRALSAKPKAGSGNVKGLSLATGANGTRNAVFDQVDFRGLGNPLYQWSNGVGGASNRLINSVGFDDDLVVVTVTGTSQTIDPPCYARAVRIASSGSPASVNNMAAPFSGSPQRTMLVGSNVTVTSAGTSNLTMGAALTGGNKTIVFQWRADVGTAGKWQEVGRYG